MSEPTPPDKIVFRSDMQTASQKPADYFAEQNKQRAEKKAKQKKQVKLALWIGIPIILILVAGLVVWLVMSMNKSPNATDDSYEDESSVVFEDGEVSKNILDLNDLAVNAYQAANNEATNESSESQGIQAAEAIFDKASALPQNKDFQSQIYLSKMMFYVNNGYYDLAIGVIDNIDPNDLATEQRALFYSYASMSYYYIGNNDEYIRYQELNREIQHTLSGYGG